MTHEEIIQAIQNLTDRMNRVEANVAHDKIVVAVDPAASAIDNALVLIGMVQERCQKQNRDLDRIAEAIRHGR